MCLDGRHGDRQFPADLLQGVASGHQGQNAVLAWREAQQFSFLSGEFSGQGRHNFTAVILSAFELRSISPETNPPQWPSDGIRLGQWTGFSPAVAMEGSVGRFKLIPNTVRVFKG